MQLNDKVALKKLREKIDAALATVASEFGLTKLGTGNIRFEADGTTATIQLRAEALSASGRTKEEEQWGRYAEMFGLKPEWLHETLPHKRSRVEILGLDVRRSRFPVIVKDTETSKRFLITLEEVKRRLGGANGTEAR